MRSFVIAGVFVLAAVPFAVHTPCGERVAFAASGCCKQRIEGDWVKVHSNLSQCKKQNRKDGDNIFQPQGKFWWDRRC